MQRKASGKRHTHIIYDVLLSVLFLREFVVVWTDDGHLIVLEKVVALVDVNDVVRVADLKSVEQRNRPG